jgi:hypothetical protein
MREKKVKMHEMMSFFYAFYFFSRILTNRVDDQNHFRDHIFHKIHKIGNAAT